MQVFKQIVAINAITAGTEIYYNKFERSVPDPPNNNASPYSTGIHTEHAFLFGKVIFSQQIFWYVFNQTNYFSNYYHRWGLTYQVHKYWVIGANLRAHPMMQIFLICVYCLSFSVNPLQGFQVLYKTSRLPDLSSRYVRS